jgi:hypothetical protein
VQTSGATMGVMPAYKSASGKASLTPAAYRGAAGRRRRPAAADPVGTAGGERRSQSRSALSQGR